MIVQILATLLNSLGFVVLYILVGFGPGFVCGLLLANRLFAKGQPTYMDTHVEAIARAAQHNAQWTPSNERWHK